MGNQPLGDDEPQVPQRGNVTAQFPSAQHSEKSFQRKKCSFLFARGNIRYSSSMKKKSYTPF